MLFHLRYPSAAHKCSQTYVRRGVFVGPLDFRACNQASVYRFAAVNGEQSLGPRKGPAAPRGGEGQRSPFSCVPAVHSPGSVVPETGVGGGGPGVRISGGPPASSPHAGCPPQRIPHAASAGCGGHATPSVWPPIMRIPEPERILVESVARSLLRGATDGRLGLEQTEVFRAGTTIWPASHLARYRTDHGRGAVRSMMTDRSSRLPSIGHIKSAPRTFLDAVRPPGKEMAGESAGDEDKDSHEAKVCRSTLRCMQRSDLHGQDCGPEGRGSPGGDVAATRLPPGMSDIFSFSQ